MRTCATWSASFLILEVLIALLCVDKDWKNTRPPTDFLMNMCNISSWQNEHRKILAKFLDKACRWSTYFYWHKKKEI